MSIAIEVVYALAETQACVALELPDGSTVLDAIEASGLLDRLAEIRLERVGVWGRPVTPQTRLRHRDRVEIYRPLIADPKEARRARAAKRRS